MAKYRGANNRFMHWNRIAYLLRDKSTRRSNLFCLNVCGDVKEIFMSFERHNNFLKRNVAGSFSDAQETTLYLSGSCLNAGKSVCNRKPKIIMAMDTHCKILQSRNLAIYVFDKLSEISRQGIADCIWYVNGCCACSNCGSYYIDKILLRSS